MLTSSVSPPEPIIGQPPRPVYTEPVVAAQNRATSVQSSPTTPPPAEANPQPVTAQAKQTPGNSPMDINLRFLIDQKTQDLTVFMLNQKTREVIRTIPPNELSKLKPGDLVNLFA